MQRNNYQQQTTAYLLLLGDSFNSLKTFFAWLELKKGTSANAGPHYQKLYARVTHIWGNNNNNNNNNNKLITYTARYS